MFAAGAVMPSLLIAAKEGDKAGVEDAIRGGANVNQTDAVTEAGGRGAALF
jgi:hypothetical protein